MVFAVCLAALSVAAVLVMPHSVSDHWPRGWQIATVGSVSSLGLTSIASVYQAFPSGLGRWDLANMNNLISAVVYGANSIVVLLLGDGIAALGVALFGSQLVSCVVAAECKRRMFPDRLSLRFARWSDLKALWSYGLNVQLVNLVQVINQQADKPILLLFTNLRFVGLYELGSRAAYSLRSIPLTAFGPLMAAAARESASDEKSRLRAFYERNYQVVLVLAVAPMLALYGASYVLIIAWLGPDYSTSGIVALVLGAGYTINIATGAGTTIAMGSGRPDIDRNYSLLGFALNMGLTVVLGLIFGPWGVVVATALGLILSSVVLLRLMDRWLGSGILPRGIFGDTTSVSGVLGFGLLIGGLAAAVGIAGHVSGRLEALGLGVLAVAVFAAVWIPCALRNGMLGQRFSRFARPAVE